MRSKNTTGGGSQTNVNGLTFESKFDLETILKEEEFKIEDTGVVLSAKNKEIGEICSKHDLYKFLKRKGLKDWRNRISKQLLPDEAFYNKKDKILYIIEKKYQERDGSVDEKLQTIGFKIREYKKLVENIEDIREIKYIYILSEWYKKEKYMDVLDYIEECNGEYYFEEFPLEVIGL